MSKSSIADNAWEEKVKARILEFCNKYSLIFKASERERAASFEIGCLHLILASYKDKAEIFPQNLIEGKFRYLTSPNGNPHNFSWIKIVYNNEEFELRQQVRIQSHLHSYIAFCPDIVLLKRNTKIDAVKNLDFAKGKRSFYSVKSDQVISAHECKSLSPFPELLVSYIGILEVAHSWYAHKGNNEYIDNDKGIHLAPTLFIGGDARPIQRNMMKAMEAIYPINIMAGLHYSEFRLLRNVVTKGDYVINYLRNDITTLCAPPKVDVPIAKSISNKSDKKKHNPPLTPDLTTAQLASSNHDLARPQKRLLSPLPKAINSLHDAKPKTKSLIPLKEEDIPF